MRTSMSGPNPLKGTQGRSTISNSSSGVPKSPRMTQAYNSKTPTKAAPNPWAQSPQATAKPTGGGYKSQSTIKKPRYISDESTQDSINNTLAQGYANADERFQTKSLDRAGLSRGAGQQFMAGQEGVKKMQESAGAAADVQASDQRTNDQMRSDYQKASEQEAQNNSMIQHQLAQTAWQQQFAQQSLNAQLQMAQEQAMLQLRLALFR